MSGKIISAIFFILFVFVPPVFSDETFKINTSIKPPFSTAEENGFFDQLVRELFGRLDISIDLVRLPSERALQMADNGYSDGDLPRISGLSSSYPHLVKVPEPVFDYYFVAFMPKPADLSMSWERLAGKKLGQLIGWKIYENNIPEEAETIHMTHPLQLFRLLDSQRIEIALYERYAGKYLIDRYGLDRLAECSPPLAVRPMFLYVNEKHTALVERLATELKQMKQDGSWQRIAAETLMH